MSEITSQLPWRCFHCDEVFTTEHGARLHFGETECREPACQIKAGAEMSMLRALREAEDEARKAVLAMHEEGTDGWVAFRRLEGRTRENAEAAENLGYERGLRDGRAEVQLFGPYAHLNGPRGLPEDSWSVEDDPIENNEEYFSIPLFAKIDVTFPVTHGAPDAAADRAYAEQLRQDTSTCRQPHEFGRTSPMKLTLQAKLDALAYRFYQGAAWSPKAGDFYTTSRADLELYQIVSVENGIVRTRYTEGTAAIAEWPEAEFLSSGFGPKRVFVPDWVLKNSRLPIVDGEELDVVTRGELENAVALLVGTGKLEELPSYQIQRIMTVGQYLTDRGLAEIERRGELQFAEGSPVLPYLSEHMIETILTRQEPASGATDQSLADHPDVDTCSVCAEPLESNDLCATDITMGICHAACAEIGAPVPTFRYGDQGTTDEA